MAIALRAGRAAAHCQGKPDEAAAWRGRSPAAALAQSTDSAVGNLRAPCQSQGGGPCPQPRSPLAETLGALCKVKEAGLARNIGVSNFTVALIEEATQLSSERLVCDQVELHPFIDQSELRLAC